MSSIGQFRQGAAVQLARSPCWSKLPPLLSLPLFAGRGRDGLQGPLQNCHLRPLLVGAAVAKPTGMIAGEDEAGFEFQERPRGPRASTDQDAQLAIKDQCEPRASALRVDSSHVTCVQHSPATPESAATRPMRSWWLHDEPSWLVQPLSSCHSATCVTLYAAMLQVPALCRGATDMRAGHPAEDGAHTVVQLGHGRRRAGSHRQRVSNHTSGDGSSVVHSCSCGHHDQHGRWTGVSANGGS